ncbi:MAG: DUF1028 domain-containing protein [Marmoricola sp.]
MTFSIVARAEHPSGDPEWGVAVASKFLAVGAAVPAAVAGVGAIATQANANVAFKGIGLSLLDEGATAEVALQRMLEEDDQRDHRQVGIVDSEGAAASHTGPECFDWAGGRTAPGMAAQGNILVGPDVVESMVRAWHEHDGEPLSRRLLAALAAGDAAGGDRRGRQSAALLVVRERAGYGGLDDVAVDLRIDDHEQPVAELARLLDLNDLYLTASTEDEQVPVDATLREELDDRARAAGHRDFLAWVGAANYEMRVAEDAGWVDRRVLAIIRGEEQ